MGMDLGDRLKKGFPFSTEQRERLWAIVVLLGIVGTLPAPNALELNIVNFLMIAPWLSLGFLAVVIWCCPVWTGPLWFLSLSITLLVFLKLKIFYPLAMILLWGAWFWFRTSRNTAR